ncbi:homoserine kinase [Microbispora triticiradicis]|uniref:Homoserine kinase n=3 Tax=Microbispora TaxID=2005 RepID=A0ABY3LXC9_9ACTN|nr:MULTISPECIES: homoserine kinase [Microbispora]RGA04716.1 homoserine kinase [Microbispora triticiradicis]TLP55645.1 homoserine kinase [Microbispora fusca]TYB57988.1 homoserine kinase [Microbispora tritici]GLW24695.1 homoserine kinase [Microbispora amethystogenes]
MTDSHGVVVRVPATSANLGPGFDSLGLALDLYDEVEAAISDSPGVRIAVEGQGAGELDDGEGHLVVRTMRATFDRMGFAQPGGIELRCRNRIPHARGLGSSSAAICAGILAARALARRRGAEDFPDADVFALATELEGHPDNVAPCLAGGLTIAWTDQSGVASMVKLTPHEDVRPVALIPDFRLSTEEARGLLPKDVPHSDAAANAGRAALLVAALTERPEPGLLLAATEDRLHQRYRAPAMPRTADLVRRLRTAGVPAVVSGAGPTVLALTTTDAKDLIAAEVGNDWHIQPMNVDPSGAFVRFPETR